MADGEAIFRVSVRGAGRTGRRLSALGREIQDELIDEMRDLGDESEDILGRFAPTGVTGKLRDEITVVPHLGHARIRMEVHSLATDRESGFNYTRVSRFGHRRRTIYPKKHRALAIDWLKDWSLVDWVPWVRAAHPASDWVDDAFPELEAEAERTMGRIERAIDTRLLR